MLALPVRRRASLRTGSGLGEILSRRTQADHLPKHKHCYARLKIEEYQERFPESDSVADCYGYVVQAVTHQINLTVRNFRKWIPREPKPNIIVQCSIEKFFYGSVLI